MRILTFTTLYPNALQPRHGIFVETRLRKLVEHGQVKSVVVAPVPWFPFGNKVFGQYAQYAKVPARESRGQIEIYHPRYPVIPRIGMNYSPYLLSTSVRKCIRSILESGFEFDLIDAHYFYPDGVAAIRLGEYFNKPVVITARGSDINLIATFPRQGKMIQDAASKAAAIITVSAALKENILDMGVDANKVVVLRNGVDINIFRPSEDREACRRMLGVSGTVLLSVGNLVELKGHHLVIEAVSMIPDARLVIVGSGPEKEKLINRVSELSLQERVIFIDHVPQDRLYQYYSAADILVLASSREGWPNVLLESMACGTPVVATRINGTPEIVRSPEAGMLIEERSAKAIAEGVFSLRNSCPDRGDTRRYSEKFGWDETTTGQEQLFHQILHQE